MSQVFVFGFLLASEKLKIFCYQRVKEGYINSICVKPTLCMYGLHSLHGKFSGFHFLTSLLKVLIAVNFFKSRGTMFQTWEPRYKILFIPWKTLKTLGKTRWILQFVNIMPFFKTRTYYSWRKVFRYFEHL